MRDDDRHAGMAGMAGMAGLAGTDANGADPSLARAGASPIIATSGLTKVYTGTDFTAVVDGLDLTIGAGEIFGLLGPNGAGKTTTAGMLTTRVIPTSGSARIGSRIVAEPSRSTRAASRAALSALIVRDLVVLRKHIIEFIVRTLIQPFLLVFVFLYVFPTIGQGIGGGGGRGHESAFATVLVPGVVAISIMFQGITAVALQTVTEFGYTREIEDRVQAPCPIWLVAMAKVMSGAVQGLLAALIVFPIAAVVHAPGVQAHRSVHWAIVVTLIPLACVATTSLGLLLGTTFEPRNIGLMFGFVVLPLTFLGGTYYQWTKLAPVAVDGIHWLQILVLVNPLIYVAEGMRAGLTHASHMHLYIVYPVLVGFCVVFLTFGLRNFRRRVVI